MIPMKAQVSSEFMVVYTALMILFVVMFTIFFGSDRNLLQTADSVSAMRNAQALASAVNYVYLAGDGASYDYTIGSLDEDENLTMSDFSVTSESPEAYASAPLLDGKRNATALGPGSINIANNRGEVHISR
jgi:hypothetical protein